jgi:hypothetical protein
MHEDMCCPWNNRRRNTATAVVLFDLKRYYTERGERIAQASFLPA